MSRDDIIRMAREAGCPIAGIGLMSFSDHQLWAMLQRFASLIEQHLSYDSIHTCHDECPRPACVAGREVRARAAKTEREACAKVAELVAREIDDTNSTATYIAAAIRARGAK